MYTSNIDIIFVCLTFFCKHISQEFNSASRSSRVLCLFYLFLFIFFLILMFVYVPATFTVALCWLFLFFPFLFFYYCYCNNVFCVTTSHRYLHWATRMESSVNSDNEKSRFIRGICRQHCLPHVSFRATFAYIIRMYMYVGVRMCLCISNLLNCLPHCWNENWTWTEMEIVIKFETKTKSQLVEY